MDAPGSTLVIGSSARICGRLAESLESLGRRVERLSLPGELSVEEGAPLGAGDPRAIDFGLGGQEYLALVQRTRRLVVAVLPEQDVPAEIERARAVRVASEVKEFVDAGGAPEGVVFLSSLLVFGSTTGRVREPELQVGQRFDSAMEESLAVAERILERVRRRVPVSVLRAAPLVGDLAAAEIFPRSPFAELLRRVQDSPSFVETSFHDRPLYFDTLERVVLALSLLEDRSEPVTAHLVDRTAPTDRELLEWLGERQGRRFSEPLPGARVLRAPSPFDRMSSPERRAWSGWELEFERAEAERVFPEILDPPWEPLFERLLDSNARRAAEDE